MYMQDLDKVEIFAGQLLDYINALVDEYESKVIAEVLGSSDRNFSKASHDVLLDKINERVNYLSSLLKQQQEGCKNG